MLFIIIICIMSVLAAGGAGAGACMTTVVGPAGCATVASAARGAAAAVLGLAGPTCRGRRRSRLVARLLADAEEADGEGGPGSARRKREDGEFW